LHPARLTLRVPWVISEWHLVRPMGEAERFSHASRAAHFDVGWQAKGQSRDLGLRLAEISSNSARIQATGEKKGVVMMTRGVPTDRLSMGLVEDVDLHRQTRMVVGREGWNLELILQAYPAARPPSERVTNREAMDVAEDRVSTDRVHCKKDPNQSEWVEPFSELWMGEKWTEAGSDKDEVTTVIVVDGEEPQTVGTYDYPVDLRKDNSGVIAVKGPKGRGAPPEHLQGGGIHSVR
jgi:hypothetical protein